MFFFSLYGDPRDLHLLTHSFPTRRSSDLDVILGILVEIALPERVGVEAVKQLGDLVDSKLDDIFRNVCCHRDPSLSRNDRSEEHTSELQSLMRISYAVFCLKKKTYNKIYNDNHTIRQTQHYNQLAT